MVKHPVVEAPGAAEDDEQRHNPNGAEDWPAECDEFRTYLLVEYLQHGRPKERQDEDNHDPPCCLFQGSACKVRESISGNVTHLEQDGPAQELINGDHFAAPPPQPQEVAARRPSSRQTRRPELSLPLSPAPSL